MDNPNYMDPLAMEKSYFGVLFLDIDGVICTDRAYYASGQHKDKTILRAWDPISIKLIDQIVRDYNLQVVISSTWRYQYDVPLLLLTHGFTGDFHKDEKTPMTLSSRSRGCEIHDWLEDHPEVNNFVIIDDCADGIVDSNLQPFHVRTHECDGFLTENWHKAKLILNALEDKKLKFDRDDRWLDDSFKKEAYLCQI